jgi:hypothetical protein
VKFLQANQSVVEGAMRQCAQAWLDFQDEVRKAEHDAHQAAVAAARKHINAMAQPGANPEEIYSTRARAQFDYEKEIRQIYSDTQTKLTAVAQKTFGEGGTQNVVKDVSSQRQDAYQAYLADLRQAWSGMKTLDPHTINAIASSILFTISAASQAG